MALAPHLATVMNCLVSSRQNMHPIRLPNPTLKESLPGRQAGVLLHPTCLGGPSGSGTFGNRAATWIALLARHGLKIWQVLPLAPTDALGSPYNSPSASALNPRFLDVERVIASGLISRDGLERILAADGDPDDSGGFGAAADAEAARLSRALLEAYRQGFPEPLAHDFVRWRDDQAAWLEDHCLYMAIKDQQQGKPWWNWEQPLAQRHGETLTRFRHHAADVMDREALLQWQLDSQWKELLRRAQGQGVRILGDMPFYVAHDSSDVWSHPQLFNLDPEGGLLEQSGVPPDYFSATGQLWATPTFHWANHQEEGFGWWSHRIHRQLELADLLRIDHFRAFEAYWAVPGQDCTAQNGAWRHSPGAAMLQQWYEQLGGLPIVAEDLGVITEDVVALRDRFRLPGMKVLQFAFDGNPGNPYLPHNYDSENCIVFTGTHDNATSVGWWQDLDADCRARVEAYIGYTVTAPGWQLLRLGLASRAALVVTPLQDLMELGDAARFNRPGTIHGNWNWTVPGNLEDLAGDLQGYAAMAALYGRGGSTSTSRLGGRR